MDRTIRLLLVGPYQLHLDCLATALAATGRFVVSHQARSLEEAARGLGAARPHLLLIDARVARRTDEGCWAAAWSRNGPEVKVLVLGAVEEESAILGWIESGADGVHLKEKPLQDLLCNIEHLLQGEVVCPPELFPSLFARLAARGKVSHPMAGPAYESLTQREREIHRMLIECLSNKQIATRLRLSLHTVKNHVHHILEKLGLQDRLEVVKQAHQKAQGGRALPPYAGGTGEPD